MALNSRSIQGTRDMLDLLKSTKMLLERSGFKVARSQIEEHEILIFENVSIVGFCSLFNSTQELIKDWEKREENIVDSKIKEANKGASAKLWNTYNIFLCSDFANSKQKREIDLINENVALTRKISGSGINTVVQLQNVIIPILPFQVELKELSILKRENVYERLSQQVSPELHEIFLSPDAKASDIIKRLGELK